ncbi:hypothetical protein DKP84_06225 [Acinetobacter pittii]|nr:hypothetical protein DKP84_06225 [Acinetobacter pittii]
MGYFSQLYFFWLYVSFKLIMKFYNLLNENNNKRKENNLFFDIFYILFFSCLGGFFFYNAYMEKDLTSFSIILIRYITFALALLLITSAIKHFLSITSCDRKLKIKIKKIKYRCKEVLGKYHCNQYFSHIGKSNSK